MHYYNDYCKVSILASVVNIIMFLFIQFDYSFLLIYFNSICLNLIMFYDIYFEMKYHRINFEINSKYYPSNRKYLKMLWNFNILSIIGGSSYICYNFWINTFNGFTFTNRTSDYIISLIVITSISNIIVYVSLITFLYYSIIFFSNLMDTIKMIMFNYVNQMPLLYNIKKEDDLKNCWICNKSISKHKIVKKLNCPCQEHFHPDCIDNYLGIYNNYCRSGHKIAKYEHTV